MAGGCCCKAGKVQRCYYDGSALRVTTFELAEVTANPLGRSIVDIPNVHNANYSGLAAMVVTPGGSDDSQIVLDLGFVNPRDGVMQVRITTNYGNILNDFDNIFNPTVQLFDENNVALTAPFVASAANGGGFFVTPVPGAPINGVSLMRVTNLRGDPSLPAVCCSWGIREIELMSLGIGPAALIYCPQNDQPLSWVDPRNGNIVDPSDLTDCR